MTQLQILWNTALFLENEKCIAFVSFPTCSQNLKIYCIWVSGSMPKRWQETSVLCLKILVLYHLHIGHHKWLKCVLLSIIWDTDKILKYPCTQGWPQRNSPVEVHRRLTVIHWWPFSECDPMAQVFEIFSSTICFKLWISYLIPGHTHLKKKRIIYEVVPSLSSISSLFLWCPVLFCYSFYLFNTDLDPQNWFQNPLMGHYLSYENHILANCISLYN